MLRVIFEWQTLNPKKGCIFLTLRNLKVQLKKNQLALNQYAGKSNLLRYITLIQPVYLYIINTQWSNKNYERVINLTNLTSSY